MTYELERKHILDDASEADRIACDRLEQALAYDLRRVASLHVTRNYLSFLIQDAGIQELLFKYNYIHAEADWTRFYRRSICFPWLPTMVVPRVIIYKRLSLLESIGVALLILVTGKHIIWMRKGSPIDNTLAQVRQTKKFFG